MTEDIAPDTTNHEPSMTAGEVEMLLFALDRSRAQFAWKCGALDAAGLSKPHPPTAMTLGGLLKHLALIDDWTTVRLTGQPMVAPWDTVDWYAVDWDANPDWVWHSAADDPPEELYRLWREAVERSRAAIAALLADGGLDQPVKLTIESAESPNVRRLLVDLHDEYARHVGHADLLREAVDGLVGRTRRSHDDGLDYGAGAIPAEQLTSVPANEASWEDLRAIFGTADYAALCQCQRVKIVGWMPRYSTYGQRVAMLRLQTA